MEPLDDRPTPYRDFMADHGTGVAGGHGDGSLLRL
jgi:hypothetical protein